MTASQTAATCTRRDEGQKSSLHIAPMLHVSLPEFHALFRILSKHVVLWTEMIVDETLVFTENHNEHLYFEPSNAPIICQLGGCTPDYARKATRLVEQYGYSEINLNVDCPSNRVSGRCFGAILMKHSKVCVEMVKAMHDKANIPISVKCRIGIDNDDSFDFLIDFIQQLTPYCKKFFIRARVCLLQGLNPAQNRIIPPLNYPRVYALCQKFPECKFVLNGGIAGLQQAKTLLEGSLDVEQHTGAPCSRCKASNGSCVSPPSRHLVPPNLDGCMLGRAAMDNPSLFWNVDRYFYNAKTNPCRNRRQVLQQYCDFLRKTYPRRCCDTDARMTSKIPTPIVVHESEYCSICGGDYENRDANLKSLPPKQVKITSRVIDRSLKPVLGMCFGLHKSKVFRRKCDELSRDLQIRNCGPAFILETAMRVIPQEVLNQDFCPTQDLTDVVLHISPTTQGCSCCCQED